MSNRGLKEIRRGDVLKIKRRKWLRKVWFVVLNVVKNLY